MTKQRGMKKVTALLSCSSWIHIMIKFIFLIFKSPPEKKKVKGRDFDHPKHSFSWASSHLLYEKDNHLANGIFKHVSHFESACSSALPHIVWRALPWHQSTTALKPPPLYCISFQTQLWPVRKWTGDFLSLSTLNISSRLYWAFGDGTSVVSHYTCAPFK